jgi:hypothetical protein
VVSIISARKARNWSRRRQPTYEDEAYRLWQIKQQGKQKAKPAELFDAIDRRRNVRHAAARRECRSATATPPRCTRTTIRSASGSGCMSKRTSMILEEEIKLHRFAGISPEQSFTEAGRHREAVVAAD